MTISSVIAENGISDEIADLSDYKNHRQNAVQKAQEANVPVNDGFMWYKGEAISKTEAADVFNHLSSEEYDNMSDEERSMLALAAQEESEDSRFEM